MTKKEDPALLWDYVRRATNAYLKHIKKYGVPLTGEEAMESLEAFIDVLIHGIVVHFHDIFKVALGDEYSEKIDQYLEKYGNVIKEQFILDYKRYDTPEREKYLHEWNENKLQEFMKKTPKH